MGFHDIHLIFSTINIKLFLYVYYIVLALCLSIELNINLWFIEGVNTKRNQGTGQPGINLIWSETEITVLLSILNLLFPSFPHPPIPLHNGPDRPQCIWALHGHVTFDEEQSVYQEEKTN